MLGRRTRSARDPRSLRRKSWRARSISDVSPAGTIVRGRTRGRARVPTQLVTREHRTRCGHVDHGLGGRRIRWAGFCSSSALAPRPRRRALMRSTVGARRAGAQPRSGAAAADESLGDLELLDVDVELGGVDRSHVRSAVVARTAWGPACRRLECCGGADCRRRGSPTCRSASSMSACSTLGAIIGSFPIGARCA